MARTFWKGSISFGLVTIPVRLQPAVESHDLSFSLLDRKDFSPVGIKRYNKKSGRDVPWDQVVRGYEYEPDEFVVLTDEDLRRANVEATQTIEILEFVPHEEIDPEYFETPYFVEPQRGASKSYALLRAAMERSGKVGIARVVLRTRQHIAALMVRDRILMLDLLRYAHELKKADAVEAPPKSAKGAVSDREVRMAEQLIAGMSGHWNPGSFKDEYRDDVLAMVRKKVKSVQIHTIVEPEPSEKEPGRARTQVMDLLPLLKESLEAHGRGKPRAAKPRRTRSA